MRGFLALACLIMLHQGAGEREPSAWLPGRTYRDRGARRWSAAQIGHRSLAASDCLRDTQIMRVSHGTGFARCAYRNARRMEDLLPIVQGKKQQEAAAFAQLEAEPDLEYEAEVARRLAEGVAEPLERMSIRLLGPEEQELDDCATTVIVMAHMAVESYIYDFAGRELGDDAANELDKLSPVGKWLFVPSLVCGHAFEKGAGPFNQLKRLTVVRNKFAHPKSREVSAPEPKGGINVVDEARAALRTLEALRIEAERFDDSGSPEIMLSDFQSGIVLSKETRERIEREAATTTANKIE